MQRWYVAQPLPQERFCQLTAGRLLALSEVDFPPRLLYNMKAACSEVDFEDLNSTVCTIRGVEVGSTARWLAQFTPLTSELQQVLDAMRLQLPSRVRTAYGPSRCSTGSHLTHTHTHTRTNAHSHSHTSHELAHLQGCQRTTSLGTRGLQNSSPRRETSLKRTLAAQC